MNTETNYAATFYAETENDAAVLEKNVMDYPCSSVARFLLLYHYKKNNDYRFEELAKQTAIYLHNPLWAQFQLSRADEFGNIFIKEPQIKPDGNSERIKEDGILIENEDAQNGINIENKLSELPVNEQISENLISDSPNSDEGIDQFAKEATIDKNHSDINLESASEENNHEPSSEIKDDSEQLSKEEIAAPVNEPCLPAGRQINDNSILGIEPAEEKQVEFSENPKNETNSSEEEHSILKVPTDDATEITLSENKEDKELGQKSFTENSSDSQIDAEKLNKSTNNNTSQNEEAAETEKEEDVPFEPLHTVDYFASQGIKIAEEALENDALGKQVKSFTAWLKSMKKLHPGQLPEQNEVIERIIQASSEVSNQNAHVLTEAMAEVLVKQGKQEKAIEMYQKLSLLNPSKSAYFAAKIENLNTI